ncbi:MAG: DUF3592 domain-containing protein [Muricoprocola sp.]
MLRVSCIFIALGALMVLLGRMWRLKLKHEEVYHGEAVGTVTEIVPGEPDEEGIRAGIHDYYYPVVTYYAKGLLHKVRSEQGSNPCKYQVNQKVEIRYDEDKTYHFVITESTRAHKMSDLLYYGGLFVCCIGGFLFLLFATRS